MLTLLYPDFCLSSCWTDTISLLYSLCQERRLNLFSKWCQHLPSITWHNLQIWPIGVIKPEAEFTGFSSWCRTEMVNPLKLKKVKRKQKQRWFGWQEFSIRFGILKVIGKQGLKKKEWVENQAEWFVLWPWEALKDVTLRTENFFIVSNVSSLERFIDIFIWVNIFRHTCQ